ncbi:YciI family protein [Alkalihalobacillus oceani]|uniref:YciI family protein n=1 Tax=Halalkalibacter oceani TaxID=1653776 RepID=UPI002041066A|nr:YciI family protein [Halalkalibacter oceani]MCM3762514.1 YciI family protein [Halalkalibacter oceani]
MRFLFIYRGGHVPEEKAEQNIRDLWRWLDELKENGNEVTRFAGNGRRTVTGDAVDEYEGDIFGISIVEANSLEEATSLTANWPELRYGGKVDIIEAL